MEYYIAQLIDKVTVSL